MKLTLERAELVQLIGKALGYDLEDDDVVVNAEPFEVRIQNVNLAEMSKPAVPPDPDPLGIDDDFLTDTDDETGAYPDEEVREAASVMTMSDVLNLNSGLGGPTAPTTVVEDEPERPLGANESIDPPPFTDEEFSNRG